MIRFLVDAQLPPALAEALTGAGCAAEHLRDTGRENAKDGPIWVYAATRGLVVLTKDEDFARRRLSVSAGPQIVWVRLPNMRKALLVQRIVGALPGLLTYLRRGEPLVVLVDGATDAAGTRYH